MNILRNGIITIIALFITKNNLSHPDGHQCLINFLRRKTDVKKILSQYA